MDNQHISKRSITIKKGDVEVKLKGEYPDTQSLRKELQDILLEYFPELVTTKLDDGVQQEIRKAIGEIGELSTLLNEYERAISQKPEGRPLSKTHRLVFRILRKQGPGDAWNLEAIIEPYDLIKIR